MNVAIIVAGGIGKRMKLGFNKVFAELDGKTILHYTVLNFEECDRIERIVICAGNDHDGTAAHDIAVVKEIVSKAGFKKVAQVVAGGAARMESVENGLQAAELRDNDIVLIQDGSRLFTPPSLPSKLIDATEEYGAAICGATPKDTIQQIDDAGFSVDTFDRSKLLAIYTPAAAKWGLLKEAREQARREGYLNTSGFEDSAVLQRYGVKVRVVPCDYSNLKITTAEDMEIAAKILDSYQRA